MELTKPPLTGDCRTIPLIFDVYAFSQFSSQNVELVMHLWSQSRKPTLTDAEKKLKPNADRRGWLWQ